MTNVLRLTPGTYLKRTKKSGFWGLKRAIQEDWTLLERNLCAISQRMEVHIQLVSLDAERCPLPRSYGYLRVHETRELAEQAIQDSIDGFMVFMGYCSYILLRRSGRTLNDTRHQWEIDLSTPPQPFQPLPPEAIQAIKNSEIVDFNLPRAGLIVLKSCQFLRDVKLMIKKKMPVYFLWGHRSVTESFDRRFQLEIYRPCARDVNIAFSLYDAAHALRELDAAPQPSPPEEKKPFPKLPPGSLQKPYEGPWEYLNRRAHVIAECYRRVDSVEKVAFKQRAAIQLDFPRPGMRGPPCFLWEDTENDDGYLVRRPYGRTKADQEWYNWEKYHKRFDPWTRTWDIFPDPIPDTVLHYSQLLSADSPNHPAPPSLPVLPECDNPYDLDEYGPVEEDDIPLVPSKDQYTPVALPLVSSPRNDINDDDRVSLGDDGSDTNSLEEAFSHSGSTSSVATLPVQWESSKYDRKWQASDPGLEQDGHFEQTDALYQFSDHRDVLQNLYERFGFTVGNSTAEISPDEGAYCQRWLGHHQPEHLPSGQRASVHQFVISLITNQNNLAALQQIAEYDISQNATFPLCDQREAGFVVLPNRLDDGSLCYIIDTDGQRISNRWSILLTDPVTVLQCMRIHFKGSLKNMARYLYYSGVPFNTCILREVPEIQDMPYRPLSLGWRPKEHIPTTEDYGEYQATLDWLFSRPYARAALLEGGLVWRIALLYLSDSVLEVTRGPSLDAASLGKRWKLAGGSILYDDRLSDAEIDVICGVYEIATGELSYSDINARTNNSL